MEFTHKLSSTHAESPRCGLTAGDWIERTTLSCTPARSLASAQWMDVLSVCTRHVKRSDGNYFRGGRVTAPLSASVSSVPLQTNPLMRLAFVECLRCCSASLY